MASGRQADCTLLWCRRSRRCCAAAPALPTFAVWLLAGALLAFGLFVRPGTRRRFVGLGLLVLAASGGPLARAQACGGPFQWTAQSASEHFSGSGPSFSFTPPMRRPLYAILLIGHW